MATKQPHTPEPAAASSNRRKLTGVVVSAKMKDSAVVSVVRYVKHAKYQKFQKRSKKYLAHDPGNTAAEGERVTIEESRPISKHKRFVVVQSA
jgi:small subunit ribosomal protein S17